jgi:hypothetical protein
MTLRPCKVWIFEALLKKAAWGTLLGNFATKNPSSKTHF